MQRVLMGCTYVTTSKEYYQKASAVLEDMGKRSVSQGENYLKIAQRYRELSDDKQMLMDFTPKPVKVTQKEAKEIEQSIKERQVQNVK